MKTNFIVKSIEETQKLGKALGAILKPGDVVLLNGDLGAGKTTFTQSVAKGLDIQEIVNSPTFNIVNEYDSGSISLFHFDLYRIEDSEELFEIGFEEYFEKDGVVIIEWAEKFKEEIDSEFLEIYIENRGEERNFVISSEYPKYEELIKELIENVGIGN